MRRLTTKLVGMTLALLVAGVAFPADAVRVTGVEGSTTVAPSASTESHARVVPTAARKRPVPSIYTGTVTWRSTYALSADYVVSTQWKGIVEFTLNPKKGQTYADGSRYVVYDLSDGLISEYRHSTTIGDQECVFTRDDPPSEVRGGILEINQARNGKRTYTFDVDLDLGMQPNGCGWDETMKALANVRRPNFGSWPVRKKGRLVVKKATILDTFVVQSGVGAASWRLTPSKPTRAG